MDPTATNYYTNLYQMGDKFTFVAELADGVTSQNQNIVYIKNGFIKYGDVWREIDTTECRPKVLSADATLRSATPPKSFTLQYFWHESKEALILTVSCPAEGLTVDFNKLDVSQQAPLEWEKSQPGYTGACLVGNTVPYTGQVPNASSTELISRSAVFGEPFEIDGDDSLDGDDNNSGAHSSANILFALAAVAAGAILL